MNTPDPNVVRDFARRAILATAEDVDFMGIAEQFSNDENWPADEDDAEAMHDAVEAERRKAVVTVSWPGEQLGATVTNPDRIDADVAPAEQPANNSDQEPIGGWILWDPEGRWMHITTWTTDAVRQDDVDRRNDGWRSVSINEAEAQEFRSKGCILDRLDQTGWRAFDQLRGTTNAAGSRGLWLAARAALADGSVK